MLYPSLPDQDPEEFHKRGLQHLYDGAAMDILRQGGAPPPPHSWETLDILRERSSMELETDAANLASRGSLAGGILLDIWRMDQEDIEGSVHKAVYLAEERHRLGHKTLRNAWTEFKPVAHFFAAREWSLAVERTSIDILDQPTTKAGAEAKALEFLAVADFFREYATTRKDRRTKAPVLDAKEAWALPAHIQALANGHCPRISIPLSDEEKTVLQNYKANQRC
jgi:hypothetical protein